MAPFKPSISVVVPTLDAGRAFGTTLHRLAHQGRRAGEVLVIDGGSRDATQHIVSQFPDVGLAEVGVGPGPRAWNRACEISRGELIVFLSQDAVPGDEAWLERLLAPLDDPSVAAVYGRQRGSSAADPISAFRLSRRFPQVAQSRRAGFGDALTLDSLDFSIANAVLRRSVWRGIRFNEHLPIAADREWARQVLLASFTIAYVPEATVVRNESQPLQAVFRQALLSGWTSVYLGAEAGRLFPETEHFMRAALLNLLRRWRFDQIPRVVLEDTFQRYGYRLGRRLHGLAPSVRNKLAPEVAAELPRRALKDLERAA